MKWDFVLVAAMAVSVLSSPVVSAHMYIQADAAYSITQGGASSELFNGALDPYPANVDNYSHKTIQHGGNIGLGMGYRWVRDSHCIPYYSLGVRYQRLFDQRLGGLITQYSDPLFINYNYEVKAESNLLTVHSKIGLTQFRGFMPYVSLGIGEAFNEIGPFKENPMPSVTPRFNSPNFASTDIQHFAYSLGAGLDYMIAPKYVVSVGYEFQDLGPVSTGLGQGAWSDGMLNFKHYQINNALVSLSYIH